MRTSTVSVTCPQCQARFAPPRRGPARKSRPKPCLEMRVEFAAMVEAIKDGTAPPLGLWYNPMTRRHLTAAEVEARDLARRKSAEAELAKAQADAVEEETADAA